MPRATKLQSWEMAEGKKRKRQNIESSVKRQCHAILKQLTAHQFGWVFGKPVDPVALCIPDYFSIISKPMDLGTVKSKLDKDIYERTTEFAADIRLTFSNAMLYNPPGNDVHNIAKELSELFESRWKSIGKKLNLDILRIEQRPILNAGGKEGSCARKNSPKIPPLRSRLLHKSSVLSEKLKVPDSKAEKDEHAVSSQTYMCSSMCKDYNLGNTRKSEISISGSDNKHARSSVRTKARLSVSTCKCATCDNMKCQCSSSDVTCISDIRSDRLAGRYHLAHKTDTSELNAKEISSSKSQMTKLNRESDGAVGALDVVHTCHTSERETPTMDAVSGQFPVVDVQLSPTKALRAVMLKSRFADTILKAEHKLLCDHGEKVDPVKMQQEKERLEREQRAEKARIEAQLKASEEASRKREEASQKRAESMIKKREWEREAARIAVQKMEKTVEFEDNKKILKELEKLSGCRASSQIFSSEEGLIMGATKGFSFRNPLKWLGLSIKDDYLRDDDEEAILNGEVEEGEILS